MTFQYPLLFADTSIYYAGEIRIMPRDQFSSLLEAVGVTIVRPPEIGLCVLNVSFCFPIHVQTFCFIITNLYHVSTMFWSFFHDS